MIEDQKKYRRFDKRTKHICFCALFAGIICACTFISIPLPIGYFNLGDAAVLLSAWILGPLFGCIAAAAGSALADLLMGYVIYMPATAIIKALIVLCACLFSSLLQKAICSEKLAFIPRAISAIVGETVMVGGYFLYEATVLGYGLGAVASVPGNALQAICGVVIGTLVYTVLKKALGKRIKEIF